MRFSKALTESFARQGGDARPSCLVKTAQNSGLAETLSLYSAVKDGIWVIALVAGAMGWLLLREAAHVSFTKARVLNTKDPVNEARHSWLRAAATRFSALGGISQMHRGNTRTTDMGRKPSR